MLAALPTLLLMLTHPNWCLLTPPYSWKGTLSCWWLGFLLFFLPLVLMVFACVLDMLHAVFWVTSMTDACWGCSG